VGRRPVAAGRLRALGFSTIDLAHADPRVLEGALGIWGREVAQLARGIDDRDVVPGHEAKSIGAEETFDEDLTDRASIERTLLAHSVRVARRLHEARLFAQRVTVKIKYHDFTVKTRQLRTQTPIDDATSLYEHARSLLDRFALAGRRVRLTGVSASDLSEGELSDAAAGSEQAPARRRVRSPPGCASASARGDHAR
jgi:DNA polymerase-4